jgi:hypothetical protein
MVGMCVSHQHRIEPPHPCIDQLLAQIGRHVDQNCNFANLDE